MSTHPVNRRKKLIEVAIPLEAINAASARQKSIRHGQPSTWHLWWARRPLAAQRLGLEAYASELKSLLQLPEGKATAVVLDPRRIAHEESA